MLTEFLQLHAQVDVEVDLSDRAVDLIGEGYDLALRIGALEDSSLIARRIADVQRVYCASPSYLAARGVPARPENLAGHDCSPMGIRGRCSGSFGRLARPRRFRWPAHAREQW